MRYRGAVVSTICLASCAVALVGAGSAAAVTRPDVSTGGAHSITYNSATLSGTVNPNGGDTSYYFQYWAIRGSVPQQSIIADAGAGTHPVKVTTTKPTVTSPVAGVNVAVRIASHIGRTRRAHFARIFGTVAPAEDGAEVGILKIVHGRGVLVGGTRLRHRDPSSSSFSRVVHV